jgi:hypothetical protein
MFWACFSASPKLIVHSRILVRIKLVVPFNIPADLLDLVGGKAGG